MFQPYYGKETTDVLIRPDLPFTSRIVLHLVEELLAKSTGTGYHLYTDRFYTGYYLATELHNKGLHLTGTVMKNRQGLPAEVKKKQKMKVHDVVAYKASSDVMVLCWQDKRQILMLSNYHDADIQTVQRHTKRGQVVDIKKPTVIIDYTSKMGAVDRADHLCSSYNFARKSLKWWRKLFFWLLEICAVNSYIIFNLHRKTNNVREVSHMKYRKKLIELLVGGIRNSSRRRGRPSTRDHAERRNNKSHFIDQLEDGKAKDCAVCSDRKTPGQRKTTVYYCKTCSKHPGLHPKKCFEAYHSSVDYKK